MENIEKIKDIISNILSDKSIKTRELAEDCHVCTRTMQRWRAGDYKLSGLSVLIVLEKAGYELVVVPKKKKDR